MVPIFAIELSMIVTPIAVALAWWLRKRGGRGAKGSWRSKIAVAGLVAVSLNVALFYAWRVYESNSSGIGLGRYYVGNYVAVPLLAAGLIGSIVGEGPGRVPIAISVVSGLLMWIQPAVL